MRLLALAVTLLLSAVPAARAAGGDVPWRAWSETLFEEAARDDRFVLLNMAAVWCHWCHVMDRTTYSDPNVLAKLAEKYIPVRVDQDARPDLSYRYENFGWPATIILDGAGNEVLRRRGYVPPEVFLKLLQIAIDDPSSLPDAMAEPAADPNVVQLTAAHRQKLDEIMRDFYDRENGGFGKVHRFVAADAIEYALLRGRHDPAFADMARRTLAGARALIDPVWGGMYQYSDALDWTSPHYEKIMAIQAQALRVYALAYAEGQDPADLRAARDVARFLLDHLTAPEGSFYTSQDADLSQSVPGTVYFKLADARRHALGLPRVDTAIYARENGWAITGLLALYDVTGDDDLLTRAERAARWVIEHRRTASRRFGHGTSNEGDAYLGDSLAMAEALLALHRSTGSRAWLRLATETGSAIVAHHWDERGGFMVRRPAAEARGLLAKPVRQLDENVAATRFFNLLARYTGDPAHRRAAEHGMSWLVGFADLEVFAPGIQLADHEITREPVHAAVVGAKDDPTASALHAAARAYPARFLRLDWWDRREGPLPNPDVVYPELPDAAAFACADQVCSLPVFAAEDVRAAIRLVDRR